MFSYFIWIYIIPMMLISPFLTMSLNSWFSIWMSLELNMMSFIPLIIYSNKNYKELSMKYFIIQSFSSSMLMLSSNFLMINSFNINLSNLFIPIINMSLLIKMGAAPFHPWFINMMKNLNWSTCLTLSTWQKISPMILIMYTPSHNLIYFCMMLSTLVSSLFGLNHQSLRLIFSYSSINHLSWMLMNILISETLWSLYFMLYFLSNLSLMLMFMKLNIFYITQLYMIMLNKIKFFLIFNMLSLSGLPPMLGFLMKWFSIFLMNENKSFFILIILIFSSLLTFFYYTQLIMSLMMIYKTEIKFNLFNKLFNVHNLNFIISPLILVFANLWILNNWLL